MHFPPFGALRWFIPIVAAVIVASAPAHAAEDCYVNTFEPVAGEAAVPDLIDCPAAEYPQSALAAGHQGGVVITGKVMKDGTASSTRIDESAGASELDAAALTAVSRARFRPGRDARGAAIEVPFMITVEFWKDDVANIGTKSCADFVIDIHWLKTNHPEVRIVETHLYEVLLEKFGTDAFNKHIDMAKVKAAGSRIPDALDTTFQQCVANPSSNFMATLSQNAQIDW